MLGFENMPEVLEKIKKKTSKIEKKTSKIGFCTFSCDKYVILQNRASHHQQLKSFCDTKK